MLIWKILGVLLGLFLLFLLLRVGVEAAFGEGKTRVWLRVGPLRFRLLPAKKKPKQEKKSAKKPEKPAKSAEKKWKPGLAEWKKGAELLLPVLRKALRRTRRAIRIHPLRLHITLGGDDPAVVGQRYGWGQALLWTVMPQAEQLLTIPDPHIRLDADFDGGGDHCEGEVGARFRVGSMLMISLALLPPMLRWLRVLRAAKDAAEPEKAKKPTAENAKNAEMAEQPNKQTAANDTTRATADDTVEPTADDTAKATADDTTEQTIDDRTRSTSDNTTDEKGGHYGK